MRTQAVVFTDVGEVAFQTVEVRPPGPGEVQIRTLMSVISAGTEGWILQNRFSWRPTVYPAIPGYQRVGVVEALGKGVDQFAVGQKVIASVSNWSRPYTAQTGSHAGLGNSPVGEIYAVPNGVSDINAGGAVLAQVGYNAAQRLTLERGECVLVYGDGIVGQCAAQAARALGYWVAMAGHRTERLNIAAQHSADLVLLNNHHNLTSELPPLMPGRQIAGVLDSVQGVDAQRDYAPLLRSDGGAEIVYCGFTQDQAWADMGDLQKRQVTAHFISGWSRHRMEATLDLMRTGKMSLECLTTHLVPASDAPSMYRMILEKSEPFLGVALDWSNIG